jgi:hypothetical protein
MKPIDLLKYSIAIYLANNYSVYITNESFAPFIGYEPVHSRIDTFFIFSTRPLAVVPYLARVK